MCEHKLFMIRNRIQARTDMFPCFIIVDDLVVQQSSYSKYLMMPGFCLFQYGSRLDGSYQMKIKVTRGHISVIVCRDEKDMKQKCLQTCALYIHKCISEHRIPHCLQLYIEFQEKFLPIPPPFSHSAVGIYLLG